MPDVDASIVFLPRFTTLVGASSPSTIFEFTTLPLDVSQHSGAQFQVWRGPMSGGTFKVFLEESLDCEKWALGASTPEGTELNEDDTKFFSYSFRLRWFRLRIALTGAAWPTVTCWAEGLLRGGGGGVWPSGKPATALVASGATTAGGASGSLGLSGLSEGLVSRDARTPPAPGGLGANELSNMKPGASEAAIQALLKAMQSGP